jgi:hypothetical protein
VAYLPGRGGGRGGPVSVLGSFYDCSAG